METLRTVSRSSGRGTLADPASKRVPVQCNLPSRDHKSDIYKTWPPQIHKDPCLVQCPPHNLANDVCEIPFRPVIGKNKCSLVRSGLERQKGRHSHEDKLDDGPFCEEISSQRSPRVVIAIGNKI